MKDFAIYFGLVVIGVVLAALPGKAGILILLGGLAALCTIAGVIWVVEKIRGD